MRKKYLSALLFGALLLASAGTFTSCKDYDDDIKNLQEQINTVKTSLDELTTKVNNLGAGVKDFKYENGQLVIVTDKDTNFTVDLPACEGVTNLEIKDGVLYADGKAVGSVAGDGGSVVEIKDGVIYIDGEAKAEIGNKVAIVDNGNGTYTLTVDGKEYTLPKAVAADVTVEVVESNLFTQFELGTIYAESSYGIFWGAPSEDVSWDGPKGAVKAGQLLVGAIQTPVVEVTPATTELDEMTLKLIDSNGQYAPVSVKAIAAPSQDVITSTTRTSSSDGIWVLSLSMDESVNKDNVASVFAAKNKYDQVCNKKYALIADGHLLSGYDFVVDTQVEITESTENSLKKFNAADEHARVYYNGVASNAYTDDNAAYVGDLPMDASIELAYKHCLVYDYKYTISAEDQNDAEVAGITLKNNVLVGTASAAGKQISLDLTVIGVDGAKYIYKNAVEVAFANTVVDAQELSATQYKVPVNAAADGEYSVVINLENTFSGLTAEQAVAVRSLKWSLAEGEENTYLVDKDNLEASVKYYTDAECKPENEVTTENDETWYNFDQLSNIKTIKYAKFTFTGYNAKAKIGTHKLQLTLFDAYNGWGSQIKKVIAPVNVTIPTFDDMFTESAAWNEGVAQLRLTYNGYAKAMTLYKTANGFKDSYATITYDKVDNKTIINNALEGAITSDIINDKKGLKSTKAELTYSFADVEGFTVKSGKFDVNFMSYMEGATVKNFNDKGAEIAFEVSGDNEEFAAAKVVLNDLKSEKGMLGNFGDATLVKGQYAFSFDAKAGNKAVATIDEETGALTVSGLAVGKYETTLTITYKQAVENKEVHVSMPIKLTVNN